MRPVSNTISVPPISTETSCTSAMYSFLDPPLGLWRTRSFTLNRFGSERLQDSGVGSPDARAHRRLRRHRIHRTPDRRAAGRARRAAAARRPLRAAARRARPSGSAGWSGRSPTSTARRASPRCVDGGDVLLSTVGPFARWGEPAVRAAIAARAVYIDSTGEPPFIRRVFDEFGAPARRARRHAAARDGLRLRARRRWPARSRCEDAGERRRARRRRLLRARRRPAGAAAAGPRASLSRRRAGAARSRTAAGASGPCARPSACATSRCAGKSRPAISVGGVEHFTLPAAYPRLREVNVYLGWFGRALARDLDRLAGERGARPRSRGVRERARRAAASRLAGMGGPGPAPGTTPGHRVLHRRARPTTRTASSSPRSTVAGADAYDFTAGCLAWAARPRRRTTACAATGAAGPLEAFGLEALQAGCSEAGLARVAA